MVYPEALSQMPLPPLWSILFFLMMTMLGFSSQVTILSKWNSTVGMKLASSDIFGYFLTFLYKIICCRNQLELHRHGDYN